MIYRLAASFRPGHLLFQSLVFGILFTAAQFGVFATSSVTLAWTPSTDASVVGYNLYYGGASGVYTNTIRAANTTSTLVSGLREGATYYFAATAYDSSGVESPFSNEAIYTTPSVAANNPPTLNILGNLALNANAGLQVVSLTGITSGSASENQTLTVTAVSSNPALIPAPTVIYGSANTTGLLNFTPVSNASGTATITVSVNDGQALNNTVSRSFTVTVTAIVATIVTNQAPTLNAISNLTLNANAGLQVVSLTGITSGSASENQTLTVSAVSSNPTLIPAPTVIYGSANTTGLLNFTSVSNASGTATITVTVNDGQALNNTANRSFRVTVNAAPANPTVPPSSSPTLNPIGDVFLTKNAAVNIVKLSGITVGTTTDKKKLKLRITATSNNGTLIKKPSVSYKSSATTGALTLKLQKNATGTAKITVTASNGKNSVSQVFLVTVLDTSATPKLTSDTTRMAISETVEAILTPTEPVNGHFTVTLAGVSGQEYIIEASEDLAKWIPVTTNTAPFSFVDDQSGQFNQRFYRSVSGLVPLINPSLVERETTRQTLRTK